MSHLPSPSPNTALSPGSPPTTTHLLRRKRSSANAALTSRPSMLALKTPTSSSDAAAATQPEGDSAVTLSIEGALAAMGIQGDGIPSEEFPSLQRLIFAHLLIISAENTTASSESAATCQLHLALFQPDLLVTSSGAVYKLGLDEWTAMRDPIERLRGLVKSSQSPPAPPSSPTGEADLLQTQGKALVLGETLLAFAAPRRVYRTGTAAIFEGVQASWLVLPPANALDSAASEITGLRKVTDLVTIVVRYPEQEEAKEEADSLGAAPGQIENVLRLDLQALAANAQSSPIEGEGKEEIVRRVLDLFRV